MPSRPIIDRVMEKVEPRQGPLPTPCWIFLGGTAGGYGKIGRRKGESPASVHRVTWEHFRGRIPEGKWVLHKCDVPRCCNPDHLYIGDHMQNTQDAVDRHRYRSGDENGLRSHPESVRRGESSPAAKIDAKLVRSLRAAFDAGQKIGPLARAHGLRYHHVFLVVHRRRWKHV
jgi:hypothetical protein